MSSAQEHGSKPSARITASISHDGMAYQQSFCQICNPLVKKRGIVLTSVIFIQIIIIYAVYSSEMLLVLQNKWPHFSNSSSASQVSAAVRTTMNFSTSTNCSSNICTTLADVKNIIKQNITNFTTPTGISPTTNMVFVKGLTSTKVVLSEEHTPNSNAAMKGTTLASLLSKMTQSYSNDSNPETVALNHDNTTKETLPDCPEEPPNLQGQLEVSFDNEPSSFEKITLDNPLAKSGGHFQPPFCIARSKVAIIIPFRDRDQHLQYFLEYMLPTLQRQQLDFRIYVINQLGTGTFNRAKLMNIGFAESIKDYDFECFVFHDVDLILENDKSLYTCPPSPRHLSVGVDKFNYLLPYAAIFGGVTELTREQFVAVNGYSNEFWGWGGEDDDMYNRIRLGKMNVIRYPKDIARYKMISHQREKGNEPNPNRFAMIQQTGARMHNDGISSLSYKVISRDLHPTFTNITVDVQPPK